LFGVNCLGEMYRYTIGYHGHFNSGTWPIGQMWQGYQIVPAGDLDGDYLPDLLAVNPKTGDMHLYRQGGFGFKYPYPKVGSGWQTYKALPAGDLIGDGRVDLLGVAANGDLYLYAGKGDGTFHKKRLIGNGWKGYDLLSGADVDGDGLDDLMSRDAAGRLYFYKGLGNGHFATKVQVGNGWGPLDSGPSCSDSSTRIGTMADLDIPGRYLAVLA
ncbi:MAG: hypothetical protein FWG16_07150, partial [Micrococcales bacterium]|nr:hypothetical protein [Micrococcales bacterium]